MTEADEKRIRWIIQDELLGMIKDGQEMLSLKKDPTGMAKKALDGLANMIRQRQESAQNDKQ